MNRDGGDSCSHAESPSGAASQMDRAAWSPQSLQGKWAHGNLESAEEGAVGTEADHPQGPGT